MLSRDNCKIISFEAEDIELNGAWKVVEDESASGGKFIVWEGLKSTQNTQDPADGDAISYRFPVTNPGLYTFKWAMRQEPGVDDDKANDSWLNFPDADRYGARARQTSFGGFVKVYGYAEDKFLYQGLAKEENDNPATTIGIEFDEVGYYTMEIAGRSHGHQIDKILMWQHTAVSYSKALRGC